MAVKEGLDLNTLPVFLALVEAGGFTAAADRLGCTKTRVSLQIRKLETHLGVALFHRTTRKVHLTEAGEVFYRECQPLLDGIQGALSAVEADDHQLQGELRLTAPEDYAAQVLGQALVEFGKRHPELRIELRSGDRVSDMVQEGIDLAFRLGWLKDSTLRSAKLASFEQFLMASPEYLKMHGTPEHPAELAEHAWVIFTPLTSPLTWTFKRGDELCKVQMQARFKSNSTASLRALLEAGAGISVMADITAEEDMRTGRLVRILKDWSLPEGGVHAVYPPGRHVPSKVRAFMAFFRSYLQAKC
ncbi:LysR family transcriptional regulator [Nitrincola sp. MINF-07-Sa-05]|uniref:LysR family transcriptional regulator n=1 Tax=Nitrincola salilacus TaxID=3400273 RepID=UPI0039185471